MLHGSDQKPKMLSTRMFIAALVTIAPNWKQPKYLSSREWTNGYSCLVEYYSAVKRDKLPLHVTR
jgi:hypothetical protein